MEASRSMKRAKICKTRKESQQESSSNDRLSTLPDKLLRRILSFVSTKEVARTSLLSKRWHFFWVDSWNLFLTETSSDVSKVRSFVDFVGKMIVMCSGAHLKRFGVDFLFEKCFAPNVDLWVHFIVKNSVKNVTILCRASELMYVLPQLFYSNSSMTSLTTGFCRITPRGAIAWGSLRNLVLESVELLETVIENILSGCPVLKMLRLKACWGLNHLNIGSKSVALLEIDDWITSKARLFGPFLKITAPYVHELAISGSCKGVCKMENISSCFRANLDIKFEGCTVIPDSTLYHMKRILEGFPNVKDMELGPWYVEIVSRLVEKGYILPHFHLLSLTLNPWKHKRSIPGIIGILRSSPNLETLVISGRSFEPHQISVGRDQAATYLQNDNLNFDLINLKTVIIRGFTGPALDGEPMLMLVKFLLKRARNLKKMVIDAKDLNANGSFEDLAKIAIKLLAFPRASPEALVITHNPLITTI